MSAVTGPGGEPASVTVVLFPADIETWIASGMNRRASQSVELTPARGFAFGNLRTGRYLVVALESQSLESQRRVDIQDPDFVRSVAGLRTLVTIRGGDNRLDGLAVRRPPR